MLFMLYNSCNGKEWAFRGAVHWGMKQGQQL